MNGPNCESSDPVSGGSHLSEAGEMGEIEAGETGGAEAGETGGTEAGETGGVELGDLDDISITESEELAFEIREAIASGDWPDAGGVVRHRLPFEEGVHMGISQGTQCGGHVGAPALDFTVNGNYESMNGLKAVASAAGHVLIARRTPNGQGYGVMVVVLHADQTTSLYAHLLIDSIPDEIYSGAEVCRGQVLGTIGSTGRSSGEHLHYEQRSREGVRLQPSFEELNVSPMECNPCNTSTHLSGCYGSQNAPLCAEIAPEPPQLLAPDDDSVFVVGDSIRFRFSRSGDAPHVLKIRRSPPNGPVVHEYVVDGTEARLDSLAAGEYRWTVYFEDERCQDGQCAAAPARSFRVINEEDPCSGVDCGEDGVCMDGVCECDEGYTGLACNQCAIGYAEYPDCYEIRTCTDDCNDHGTCDQRTGSCSCRDGYAGASCNQCASGYENYPDCEEPPPSPSCRIEVSPSVNTYTPSFIAQIDCTCSSSDTDCHTLYVGRATSISGNEATLEFMKTGGGGPSVNVSYWIGVAEATNPRCTDLNSFVTRTNGLWSANRSPLQVTSRIWPTMQAYLDAPNGEQKKLFIITGGRDFEGSRIWYQRQAVVFTKVCD